MFNNYSQKNITNYIPFHRASLDNREIKEITSTLISGWLTTGPRTKKFESNFAQYIGAKHAIAVNSCTSGLHLALVAYNIGKGDEVITTPYTFAATPEVILHTGATLVLVDVEENGFNIDPQNIKAKINPKTKAILPVHFAGAPCRMNEIMKIAHPQHIFVLEDAAHALGAEYQNKKIGTIGDATVFSFYATKNLTTGEGGMITTDDDELAQKLRLLSLHGLSNDAWKRYSKEGQWYYEIQDLGFKYNLSDINSALGLVQLQKFNKLQLKRKTLADEYRHNLSGIDEIILPETDAECRHAWHLFVIRLKPSQNLSRNYLIEQLSEKGIGTSVHFIPIHLHPYYQKTFNLKRGDFPRAEAAYSSCISLPLYPGLSVKDIMYISDSIKQIIVKSRDKTLIYVKENIQNETSI